MTSIPKIGDRIRIPSIDIKGKITYIDQPNIWNNWAFPIQVLLDKPYDEHDQRMYRTHMKDLKKLKPKIADDEIFDFSEPNPKKKKKKSFDEETW